VSGGRGRLPWKGRGRRQAEAEAADELHWARYRDSSGIYLWPVGDWRGKVIQSESFAGPGGQAEPEAEAEP
jgi:hypothetical protein